MLVFGKSNPENTVPIYRNFIPSSAKCSLFIKYTDRCAKSPDFLPTPVIHKKNENKWERNLATGTKSGDFAQQARTLCRTGILFVPVPILIETVFFNLLNILCGHGLQIRAIGFM